MTPFPTLIDQIAVAVLAPTPVAENPHHRAILDAFTEVQHLDRQLASLSNEELAAEVGADDRLDELTSLLIERMAAGAELHALLATSCCCDAASDGTLDGDGDGDGAECRVADATDDDFTDEDFSLAASPPETVIDACLDVFDALGNPEYVPTADLIAYLRDRPGEADGRWLYAEINPVRLARLLIPYGVRSCKPTASDGSRYKAYRYSELLAAGDTGSS